MCKVYHYVLNVLKGTPQRFKSPKTWNFNFLHRSVGALKTERYTKHNQKYMQFKLYFLLFSVWFEWKCNAFQFLVIFHNWKSYFEKMKFCTDVHVPTACCERVVTPCISNMSYNPFAPSPCTNIESLQCWSNETFPLPLGHYFLIFRLTDPFFGKMKKKICLEKEVL
jgi:hypothetical protein